MINIHPSEAISGNVCSVCGYALTGDSHWFAVSLESCITRQTDCPPLHRGCAVGLAKSKLEITAIWQSGYSFDCMPEPVFYLEQSITPLEFDGQAYCSPASVSQGMAEAWVKLRKSLGKDAEAMGQSAARLLPRPVDFSTFDLSRPRKALGVAG